MNGPSLLSRQAVAAKKVRETDVNLISYDKPAHDDAKSSCKSKIDCTKEIVADDINYAMVSKVLECWDSKILKIPDWSRVTGDKFLRHIFRVEPKTITMFGFPPETKWDDPLLSDNKKFVQKGIRLIKAIDMAVAFLGPDLEPLQEQLYQLGWQHTAMKALPSHWPIVGEALLAVFDDCITCGITEEERDAWITIYNFMGFHMIQGLTAHYKDRGELWKINRYAHHDSEMTKIEPIPIMDVTERNDCNKHDLIGHQLARSTSYRNTLQCDKRVPSSDISFAMVNDVVMSWKKITSIPNWEKTTGDLFLRYIFKIEPGTIAMFGFPSDTDYREPDLTANVHFMTKGVVLIKAIDTAVQLLGPDLFPLEEVLYDLGKRHVIMKAQPKFWPLVGEALFLVFEECMGGAFEGEVKEAWTVMYNFLGYHMIQGLKYKYKEIKKRQERNKAH